MYVKRLLLVGALFVAATLYGFTIRNEANKSVNIKATYHGQTSFSCRPDNFTLNPGETKTIDAGWCLIKNIHSDVPGTDIGEKFDGTIFVYSK